MIKLSVAYIWRIIKLQEHLYLNLGLAQLLMTVELGLYNTPTLAAHINRFIQNQIKILIFFHQFNFFIQLIYTWLLIFSLGIKPLYLCFPLYHKLLCFSPLLYYRILHLSTSQTIVTLSWLRFNLSFYMSKTDPKNRWTNRQLSRKTAKVFLVVLLNIGIVDHYPMRGSLPWDSEG